MENQRMSIASATRVARPLIALGGASVLTAGIVLFAPEVGLVALGAMIGAWVALSAIRVVILLGVAHQLYLRCHPEPAT
jgi:hypothetical protein